jgi:hypothetical protein
MKIPTNWRFGLLLSVIISLILCACGRAQIEPLDNGKVLLSISLSQRERLLTRLGFTNLAGTGAGSIERDSAGTKMFIRVEPPESRGKPQDKRTQQLIIVTAQGTRIEPWRSPANEKVTDDAKVAIWEDNSQRRWQVRSGELLPANSVCEDVSNDWIAIRSLGRASWIAKLDAPGLPLAEFSDNPSLVRIYAKGTVVHVFTRRGWRNEEGPMRYLLFDFSTTNAKPIKQMVMPSWARITRDMDPDSGFVVLNDNNRIWGRTWLFNLNSKKRKWISTSDWILCVKKELAQKWVELTKP